MVKRVSALPPALAVSSGHSGADVCLRVMATPGRCGSHSRVWCLLQPLRRRALHQQSSWRTSRVRLMLFDHLQQELQCHGVQRTCSSSLSSYKRVTYYSIYRTIARSVSQRTVRTWLVKAAGATMTAILTKLVNSSLDSAMFPSSMKHAIVTPIIKKHGMD